MHDASSSENVLSSLLNLLETPKEVKNHRKHANAYPTPKTLDLQQAIGYFSPLNYNNNKSYRKYYASCS